MRRAVALLSLVGLAGCGGEAKSTEPDPHNIILEPPAGWAINGNAGYNIGLGRVTTHGGTGAVHISSTDPRATVGGGVTQYVLADDYRGKRVRLSGWVRHLALESTIAGLYMRVDGDFQTLAFDNSASHALQGTADWHQVEVVLDVPNDAIGLSFGVFLSGARGELVADDLSLEVVPASGPTTNTLSGPKASASDWKTYYATNVKARTPTNLDFESK